MAWLKWAAFAGSALFLYSYLLYPLVLSVVAGVVQFRRDLAYAVGKRERRVATSTPWPHMAVVIAAYNEQKHIAQRVQNLLEQDYPPDKLTLYIGSDGSKDDTAAILASVSDMRLKAFAFEVNRGKANVLNDLVSRGQEEIIVFSDANTFFAPDALKQLALVLEDPNRGGRQWRVASG